MAEQTITLEPGESKGVSFEATPHEARTYNVVVNGVTGSFKAVAPPYLDEQNLRELEVKEAMFREVIEIGMPYYDWQVLSQARMMLAAIELYRTGAPAGEIYKYLNVAEAYIDKPEYYLVGGNVPLMTAQTWRGMFDAYRAWCIEITESYGFTWSPYQEAELIKFFQEKIIDNTKQKLGKSRLKGWDY
ncbi:unnamed protein product [marine sediment metagenome]|uniref:Uncharacterized protein n=1 Tax=marine sediment metagenome TaxID=412755 RepID=X1J9J0_9ZZZZ